MACAVELDNIRPYSPGEKVTGKLICLFNTYESIEGIKCYLQGEERVSFFDKISYRQFAGSEFFLKNEIGILPASSMQPGTYHYPFSFDLPVGIPSSFEHANGSVVYEVVAEVSRGAGRYYRNNHLIQVTVALNLNDIMNEITMAPVSYPLDEVVDPYWCCSSAHVFSTMTLEKDAYLVGEDININLEVKNISSVDVTYIILKLESHTEVAVNFPQRKVFVAVDEILRKTEDGVPGNSQKVFTLSLKVPGYVRVHCLRKCKLIRQRFAVTADIFFGECYRPVTLPGFIKLGHNFAPRPRPVGLPQPHEEARGPSIQPPSRKDVPIAQEPGTEPSAPPTYDEAMSNASIHK